MGRRWVAFPRVQRLPGTAEGLQSGSAVIGKSPVRFPLSLGIYLKLLAHSGFIGRALPPASAPSVLIRTRIKNNQTLCPKSCGICPNNLRPMRLSAVTGDLDKGGSDTRPCSSLSVDGLVQQTPPSPLLFTSLEVPPDIDDLGKPFRQRRFLVILLKREVRNIRYLVPFTLYSEVNKTETIRRTYTISLTSFPRVEGARQ